MRGSFSPRSSPSPAISPPFDRERAFTAVTVAVGVGLIFDLLAAIYANLEVGDLGEFTSGYTTAQRVLATGWQGVYDLSSQVMAQRPYLAQQSFGSTPVIAHPFVGLPPSVALFVPFALLPPFLAFSSWIVVNAALAVLAIAIVLRATLSPGMLGVAIAHEPPSTSWIARFSVLIALALVPLVVGLVGGHAIGFVLILYSAAFLWLARGADRLGGAGLALLSMIHPQLVVGPLLFLIVQRRKTAVLSLLFTASALITLSICLVGLEGIDDYVGLIGAVGAFSGRRQLDVDPSTMVNLRSWIVRAPGLTESAALIFTTLGSAVLLVAVLYIWRRPAVGGRLFARAFLCFTAVGLFASFHNHYKDLVLLAPPAIAAVGLDRSAFASTLRGAMGIGKELRERRSRVRWCGRAGSRWTLLAMVAGALLLVIPCVSWVVDGSHAMSRVSFFALLAGPALGFLAVSTLPPVARQPRRLASDDADVAALSPGAGS